MPGSKSVHFAPEFELYRRALIIAVFLPETVVEPFGELRVPGFQGLSAAVAVVNLGPQMKFVEENFDLRPGAIIRDLDLRRPIYRATANYGHFGRNDIDAPWEDTGRSEALKEAVRERKQELGIGEEQASEGEAGAEESAAEEKATDDTAKEEQAEEEGIGGLARGRLARAHDAIDVGQRLVGARAG